MKSAIIFALVGTSVAIPFGNVIDAIYGSNLEARQGAPSGDLPSGIAFPSGTGHHHHHHPSGVRPTGVRPTGRPSGRPGHHHGHHSKSLAIDYALAPTALAKYKVEERQAASDSAALPSFTLANPSAPVATTTSSDAAVPTASDEPSFPTPTSGFPTGFPTELPSGFPTGFPTGGPAFPFPTGGFPHHTGGFLHPTGGLPGTGFGGRPTTLATFTRGPRPTSAPSQSDESATEAAQSFWDWLEGVIGGGKSETNN